MDVKIGVRNIARELTLESAQSPQEVTKAVSEALSAGGVLRLLDDKGRTVLVPVEALGYVEIGSSETRKVGFGTT